MSWKEFYLLPEGRVTRGEWWQWLFLPAFGIAFVAVILKVVIFAVVAAWLLVYPTIIASVKRLHDHDKTGWWYLFYIIPGVGTIWQLIECGFLRGTVGDNRYGPDPDRSLRTA